MIRKLRIRIPPKEVQKQQETEQRRRHHSLASWPFRYQLGNSPSFSGEQQVLMVVTRLAFVFNFFLSLSLSLSHTHAHTNTYPSLFSFPVRHSNDKQQHPTISCPPLDYRFLYFTSPLPSCVIYFSRQLLETKQAIQPLKEDKLYFFPFPQRRGYANKQAPPSAGMQCACVLLMLEKKHHAAHDFFPVRPNMVAKGHDFQSPLTLSLPHLTRHMLMKKKKKLASGQHR